MGRKTDITEAIFTLAVLAFIGLLAFTFIAIGVGIYTLILRALT